MVLLGGLLAFTGRRFFRICMASLGCLIGALVGFLCYQSIPIEEFFKPFGFKYGEISTLVLFAILGIVLGLIFSKVLVFVAAAIVGWVTGRLPTTLGLIPEGNPLRKYPDLMITICILVTLVLTYFFRNIATVIVSAVLGGIALVVGIDLCTTNGMIKLIIEEIAKGKIPSLDNDQRIKLGGVAVAVVAGILVQLFVFHKPADADIESDGEGSYEYF